MGFSPVRGAGLQGCSWAPGCVLNQCTAWIVSVLLPLFQLKPSRLAFAARFRITIKPSISVDFALALALPDPILVPDPSGWPAAHGRRLTKVLHLSAVMKWSGFALQNSDWRGVFLKWSAVPCT